MQDEKRLEIIQRVFRGELTVLRAAVILGLSERQCYRIKRPVHQQGEVRQILHSQGIPRPRKRRAAKHPGRRERCLAEGMILLQRKASGRDHAYRKVLTAIVGIPNNETRGFLFRLRFKLPAKLPQI